MTKMFFRIKCECSMHSPLSRIIIPQINSCVDTEQACEKFVINVCVGMIRKWRKHLRLQPFRAINVYIRTTKKGNNNG